MVQKFAPFFGALFLLSAPQAHATLASASAQASIDWSGLQVKIVDLDSSDGITPTLTWSGQSTGANAYANNANPAAGASAGNSISSWSSAFGNNAVTPYATGTYNASATAISAGATAHGNYAATSCTLYYCFPQTNTASSSNNRSGSFTMTGKGIAIVSLPWSIQASANPGSTAPTYPYYYNSTNAGATANLSATYTTAGGTTVQAYSNNSVGNPYYYYSSTPYSSSKSGTFSFAIYDDSGVTLTGNLYADLSTSATAILSPVPEAQTWGLMLAGLGLLGLRLRRRT